MKKTLLVSLTVGSLAACGGGGSDPSGYSQTTPGAGSTTATAAANGTIQYTQFVTGSTPMYEKAFTTSSVTATTTFDPTSKQGAIQFAVGGQSQQITTTDGYNNVKWNGALSSGAYKLDGNILMGCLAATINEGLRTQLFVSSSLTRIKDGYVDDLNGTSYDLFDCELLGQGKTDTLKINTDGSLSLSYSSAVVPKNQVFDMLNPDKGYGGILIGEGYGRDLGSYSGQAYKYGANGVSRFAIVIQTNANKKVTGTAYHYLLAIQK